MKVYLKVVLFVMAVAGVFAYFGNVVPQFSATPTKQIKVGETPAELIRAGKKIFEREDSCLSCHAIGEDPKARCPDHMEEVFLKATTRKEGMNAIEYLVESLYNPNAYVVEGYPKNQMKPVNRPPMSLSDDEIKAVLTYLINLGGKEVNVQLVKAIDDAQKPFKTGKIVLAEAGAEFSLPEGDGAQGRFTYQEFKCWQCHLIQGEHFGKIKEEEGGVGPGLTGIGAVQTKLYIAESIVNPNAVLVKGKGYTGDDGLSKMPEYHDSMTLRNLIDIVAYLSKLKPKK